MKLITLLMFLLIPLNVVGADKAPLLLNGLIVSSNAFDVSTTYIALHTGQAREVNTLLGGPAPLKYVIKSGMTVVQIVAIQRAWQAGSKKVAIAGAIGCAAINVWAGAHNVGVIHQINRGQ